MKVHKTMGETTHFTIRTVQIKDVSFLWDMLYEAASVSAGIRSLGKEKAPSLPANRKYVEGWGRPGDAGIIAVDRTEQPLGAAWYRLHPVEIPGYGFVSPTIPELTIGVRVDARNQGVGSALLQALIEFAQNQGYAALSLSVDYPIRWHRASGVLSSIRSPARNARTTCIRNSPPSRITGVHRGNMPQTPPQLWYEYVP